MNDREEKTRVTTVVQSVDGVPVPRSRKNDCVVIIYTKESTLLGKRFVLDREALRIGRGGDNQIVLDGDSVSRRHCHLERAGDAWLAVDDGSTNGTYVNDEQIDGPTTLANGDRIKVGPTIFKFLTGADVESQYHEEIYRMTIVDGLTQIHNKRYLDEALEREMVRARRHTRELSVLMFDIDHFKTINDAHGHLAGDFVLKELARVVQARIRRDEVFARYGGEEFVVLLPETPVDGAVALADNIRDRVQGTRFLFQGEPIAVTISVGVTELTEDDRSASDVLQRADERLYEAKRGGRNRVVS